MDQPQFAPPPNDSPDPLAIASVALAVVGVIAYCAGSFCCMSWVGPILWFIGAILGGIGIAKNEGNNRIIAIVGVVANVLLGLAMTALMVFGMGLMMLQDGNY